MQLRGVRDHGGDRPQRAAGRGTARRGVGRRLQRHRPGTAGVPRRRRRPAAAAAQPRPCARRRLLRGRLLRARDAPRRTGAPRPAARRVRRSREIGHARPARPADAGRRGLGEPPRLSGAGAGRSQPGLGRCRLGAVRRCDGAPVGALPRAGLRADLPSPHRHLRRGPVGDRPAPIGDRRVGLPGHRSPAHRRRRPGAGGARLGRADQPRAPQGRQARRDRRDRGRPGPGAGDLGARGVLPARDRDVALDDVLEQLRAHDYHGWLVVEQDILPDPSDPGKPVSTSSSTASTCGTAACERAGSHRPGRRGPDGERAPCGPAGLGRDRAGGDRRAGRDDAVAPRRTSVCRCMPHRQSSSPTGAPRACSSPPRPTSTPSWWRRSPRPAWRCCARSRSASPSRGRAGSRGGARARRHRSRSATGGASCPNCARCGPGSSAASWARSTSCRACSGIRSRRRPSSAPTAAASRSTWASTRSIRPAGCSVRSSAGSRRSPAARCPPRPRPPRIPTPRSSWRKLSGGRGGDDLARPALHARRLVLAGGVGHRRV